MNKNNDVAMNADRFVDMNFYNLCVNISSYVCVLFDTNMDDMVIGLMFSFFFKLRFLGTSKRTTALQMH